MVTQILTSNGEYRVSSPLYVSFNDYSSATMGQVFSERYQGKGEVVLFLGCRHITMSTIKNCLLDGTNASAKTLAFESLYGVNTKLFIFCFTPHPHLWNTADSLEV